MDNTVTRTDVHGRTIVERRAVSFSAIDKFTNCPRKYYNYDIAKLIKEPENPQMRDGWRVHKAMSDFIAHDTPLPPEMERYADWVTTMLTGQPDEIIHTEHRLACTFELEPCDYFSRKLKVWLRAQADLLVVNGDHALSVDWKTGKEKDERYELLPKNFQLRLTAMLIFLHFPQVQNVTSKYVYLNEGTQTTFDMPKEDLRLFVPQAYDILGGIQKSVRANSFPPRPSGLCKRHCAVTSCEFHGRGNHG